MTRGDDTAASIQGRSVGEWHEQPIVSYRDSSNGQDTAL